MSEREDEIARGVSKALQERDDKERARNGEGAIFAISVFVLLFAFGVLTTWAGLSFLWGLLVTIVGSLMVAGIIATTVSRRARDRGAPGY